MLRTYENGSDDIETLVLVQQAFEKGITTTKNSEKAKKVSHLIQIKQKIANQN